MFKKILIANRGEIALRIIRTCREMGIKSVAVYSKADRDSLHVRFADEAVCIGPAPSKDSYLNIPNIISAAEITGVDAIHPGYGFLAENSQFAQICDDYHIKFIGPKPEVIDAMGDKATAKETMRKAGVPVVPGSDGIIKTVADALDVCRDIGYPVMVKATAGGGGKGMRLVWEEKDLPRLFEMASNEAQASFGNGDLYIEKFVEDPRHIEVQVVGDQFGHVSHLSERECSIQRRHQKLVEESPSPFITPELREKMGDAAVKGAKSVNYEGAGTIEFLVDKHHNFYFMEMNTRIQVEHPVTEEVFFYDLIKEQIKVAYGIEVSGRHYYPEMHQRYAMEVRINAEDPYNDFRPSPGKITAFHKPGGHGVRVDTHAYNGYTISPYYDSMIGKLIVSAFSREEVINKMSRALEEFVVEGIHTTIPFHQKLMRNERFINGDFTTKFLEEWDWKNAP